MKDIYINFYSNNKITVTYTLSLNTEGKATAINFNATGTTRTNQTITLSSPAPIDAITIATDCRNQTNTTSYAKLQNLTAKLTYNKYAEANVSEFTGTPYIYYDEVTGEATEAKSYNDIPETAKVISKGATFTVTPNDDVVTKVTVSCSNDSAKAENGDSQGTNSTSLKTELSGDGEIVFGILDYTINGKSSIPSSSNVWNVSIETTKKAE